MSNKASTAQMFDNMSLDIEQLLAKVWQYFRFFFVYLIVGLHCNNPLLYQVFPLHEFLVLLCLWTSLEVLPGDGKETAEL